MAEERFTTLSLDMRPGERLVMGDVVVEFVHKTGPRSRVRVSAPRSTTISKTSSDQQKDERGVVPSMATCGPS